MAGQTSTHKYAVDPSWDRMQRFWLSLAVTAPLWCISCEKPLPLSDGILLGQFHDTPARATWTADPTRLQHELPTAVEKVEWAMIRQDRTPVGLTNNDAREGLAWRIRALLPDGRTASIHAWAETEATITVTVQVGRFGDLPMETRFIDALANTLARPRPTIRKKNFILPVLE